MKMEYTLNSNVANYDKNTTQNCIKTHVLEGTPVTLNTNYCIASVDKGALKLIPLRMAVQLRTNFDHVDREYESRRRNVYSRVIVERRRRSKGNKEQGKNAIKDQNGR